MNSPPSENRPGGAVLEKLQPDNRQAPEETQLLQWWGEGARPFNEFWRTGQRVHIDAFVRHMIGMRSARKCVMPGITSETPDDRDDDR
jgi:hypothetical protein